MAIPTEFIHLVFFMDEVVLVEITHGGCHLEGSVNKDCRLRRANLSVRPHHGQDNLYTLSWTKREKCYPTKHTSCHASWSKQCLLRKQEHVICRCEGAHLADNSFWNKENLKKKIDELNKKIPTDVVYIIRDSNILGTISWRIIHSEQIKYFV